MKIIILKFKMFDKISEFVKIDKMDELIEYFEFQVNYSKKNNNVIENFKNIFTNNSLFVSFEKYRGIVMEHFLNKGFVIFNKDGAIFDDDIEKYIRSDKIEFYDIIEFD